MSETEWTTRVRALVTDDMGRLLVGAEGRGLRLPAVDVRGTDDDLPVIGEALAARLGFDTIVLRSVERSVDREAKHLDLALELEPRGPVDRAAPGMRWVEAADVAAGSLSDTDRVLAERVLADVPPPERPPWARRGWLHETSTWIETALAERGRAMLGEAEQISSWCISSILRTETNEGRVYLKATARSRLFVDEGSVTRGLAALYPGRVPAPLAIDVDRRLMLLDDFGPLVGWGADIEVRRDLLAAYARMQLASAARPDGLLALGLFDRRPAWLASEIETLPQSAGELGLSDVEADALERLVPTVVDSCARLAAGPVPDTLVHGDLHPDNVAGESGSFVFFDWTDACVTHPFLDLLIVLFEDDEALRDELRDAYLDVWAGHAPRDELRELWRIAAPLACLNQVVSYRAILSGVERGPGVELESMPAYWLGKALAAANGGA